MKFRDLIVPSTNLLIDCFTSSQTPTSLFVHLFQEVQGKLFVSLLVYVWASLLAQGTHLLMQETRETHVRSLGWEDLLEKEMATHSSILAWRIP